MKINFAPRTNFKGYDAAPLKSIYMSPNTPAIFDEINKIGQEENFKTYWAAGDEILTEANDDHETSLSLWAQDYTTFFPSKNSPDKNVIYSTFVRPSAEFCEANKLEHIHGGYLPEGGNYFMGKYKNGERWALLGENDEAFKEDFSKITGIKEENIHIISQPAFHLDMAIRPVGYPYVLVNDEDLVYENIEKNFKDSPNLKESFKKGAQSYYKYAKGRCPNLKSGKEIAKELKALGFEPILIGGIYSPFDNYMNAIVNIKENGKMTYITNYCDFVSRQAYKTKEIFEKELMEKVPNIDKIRFIGYENPRVNMQDYLITDGALHCLCAEEPNFQAWG